MSDVIDLLRDLVRINSVNPDLVPGAAGETEAAAFCAQGEDQRNMGIPPHWLSYISVSDADGDAPAQYRFTDASGMCRVGWFEDSWSLGVKADWLRQQGLAGMAFFPLGYDQGVLVKLVLDRWKR